MARRDITVNDPSGSATLTLRVKGFQRGTVSGVAPTVVLAVISSDGNVLGSFEANPEDAQTLGEYLRQEAEYASKKEEE